MHDAVIIGAGIAGAAIAYELRQRGRTALVLEAADRIAAGASGNPKGMIKPWLSLGDSAMRQFYTAAYHHALVLLEKFPEVILQRGILQLPKDEKENRFRDATQLAGFNTDDLHYLTAAEASDLMQTEILSDALFWPRAMVIDPAAWVRALLGDTEIRYGVRAASLDEINAREIYVTTGHAMHLLPDVASQIRPRAGQLTAVPAAALLQLKHAVSFGHYFIPSQHGKDHIIGATYEHHDRAEVSQASHCKNLDAFMQLGKIIPTLGKPQIASDQCSGRTSVRATTANHLPLCGRAHGNVFYLTGLGSRGLMSAPYAARKLLEIQAE